MSSPPEPVLPPWIEGDVCGYCPSLRFGPGEFDVAARPDRAWPWKPGEGRRVDAESGVGVCVHPDKVRLPIGRWGSEGRLPDLTAWRAPEPAPPAAPDPTALAPAEPSQGARVRRLLHDSRPRMPKSRLAERRPPARPAAAISDLVLPDVPSDPSRLAHWARDVLDAAEPDRFADVLAAVEHAATEVHPPETVIVALRDAMS
ncbi:hypothetical protein [Embleya sp. NPDC020886]|uniref:hypothetical protein n=1 Tax=Embleya sp. NPDC020886 TaxID=3363980 RepID=UPI003798B373